MKTALARVANLVFLRANSYELRASLPPHQIRFIHIDRVPVMKEGDENGQADGGFGGGDGHHEKDEKKSVDLVELARVGDEGEVHRVHHQLDAHEDGDAV